MRLDGGNDFTQAPSLGIVRRRAKTIQGALLDGEAEDWFRFKTKRWASSGSLDYDVSVISTDTTPRYSFLPPLSRRINFEIKLFFQPKGKSKLRQLRFFTSPYPFEAYTPSSSFDVDTVEFRINSPGTYYLKIAATPMDKRQLDYSIKLASSAWDL
jgi:hypothetical protein